MGLFNTNDLELPNSEAFHHPTDHCFYCNEPLTGSEWIFWNGRTGQIWMHPACAKRLADHLNKDWDEFRKKHPEL